MSEEAKITPEVTVTPAEAKARKNGWVAEEEWKGPAEDWVNYGEYNVRGEMIGRITEQSSIISHLTNKVDERDKALEDMKALQDSIADNAYKRAMDTLKRQKAVAVEERDGEKVVEIDDDIAELRAKQAEIKPGPNRVESQEPAIPKELSDWIADPKNAWYTQDNFLKSVADGIAVGIKRQDPSISPTELLKRMEGTIKEKMPQHFQTPTVTVDDGGGDALSTQREKNNGVKLYSQLNGEEKAACDRFVKLGLMTRKDYIEALDAGGQ